MFDSDLAAKKEKNLSPDICLHVLLIFDVSHSHATDTKVDYQVKAGMSVTHFTPSNSTISAHKIPVKTHFVCAPAAIYLH